MSGRENGAHWLLTHGWREHVHPLVGPFHHQPFGRPRFVEPLFAKKFHLQENNDDHIFLTGIYATPLRLCRPQRAYVTWENPSGLLIQVVTVLLEGLSRSADKNWHIRWNITTVRQNYPTLAQASLDETKFAEAYSEPLLFRAFLLHPQNLVGAIGIAPCCCCCPLRARTTSGLELPKRAGVYYTYASTRRKLRTFVLLENIIICLPVANNWLSLGIATKEPFGLIGRISVSLDSANAKSGF